jgi:hypothetical protein
VWRKIGRFVGQQPGGAAGRIPIDAERMMLMKIGELAPNFSIHLEFSITSRSAGP